MGKDSKKPAAGKKGGSSNEKKPAADKKEAGGKKGGGDDKLKPATSINVRHILCEKSSQIQEAMDRLAAGESFDKVRPPPRAQLFSLRVSECWLRKWKGCPRDEPR
jgi:NIMA-interacting peptidyl-prolyl cis-trans isomerase 4